MSVNSYPLTLVELCNKALLSEEGMISLRKISFLVRQHRRGELSARQLCKLAKVSKSSFYRITKNFAGLNYYFIRKKLAEMKPPGRLFPLLWRRESSIMQ